MIIFKLIVSAIRDLICNDPPAPKPKPVPSESEIDAALAKLAKDKGLTDNNWRESITDLLVLLGIPNMFHYRGGLYNELGGAGEYAGTAQQNVWMIEQVRRRFAEGRLD